MKTHNCSIENCKNTVYGRTKYCSKHYQQIRTHGHVIRTRYDPNRIIEKEKWAEIELYDMKQEVVGYAKIDLQDVPLVKNHKWCISHGYVVAYSKKETRNINLSDFIMNFKGNKNMQIDHINRNKLDNTKNNLRIVSAKENVWNRKKDVLNTSGTVGVCFDKHPTHNYWLATLCNKTIGCYKEKEAAITARKLAETLYIKGLDQ